jgi:hypothetical protein
MLLSIPRKYCCVSLQTIFLQREEGTSFKLCKVLPSSALFTYDFLPLVNISLTVTSFDNHLDTLSVAHNQKFKIVKRISQNIGPWLLSKLKPGRPY